MISQVPSQKSVNWPQLKGRNIKRYYVSEAKDCTYPNGRFRQSKGEDKYIIIQLSSIYDYWKNHSFDQMDLYRQSNVSAF